MSEPELTIEPTGDGRYFATVPSLDGGTSVTLRLAQAPSLSAGRLADDEATARATLTFLLQHQDGADLPEQIELEQVMAAYDDAVDAIAALRR